MSRAALYDYDPPHKYRCGECGTTLTGYELEEISIEIENHQTSHEADHWGDDE